MGNQDAKIPSKFSFKFTIITFSVAQYNIKCHPFNSYVGHSGQKILFVVNKSAKNTRFFASIVGHSSQMRSHSCISRARDHKHVNRYFDPLTMQKHPIFIDPKPKIAPPTWSLHILGILRIPRKRKRRMKSI